jgi:hypothetical protein
MTGHVSNQHGTPATSRYAGDVLPTRRPSRCGALATLVFASPNVVLDNLIAAEINLVHEACLRAGALLKVIFENDYLQDRHILPLCAICTEAGVARVGATATKAMLADVIQRGFPGPAPPGLEHAAQAGDQPSGH